MALRCHFPFSIFFTSLQNFFTSLHHLFCFPSPFFKFLFRVSFSLFPSPFILFLFRIFFYFSSPVFFNPLQSFFFHFSIFKYILLSVSNFTSPPSLFTSLQSVQNSFYLPLVCFTTLQGFAIFLLSFSIFLLPFTFLKLFLPSLGIFIVSLLIFKYRKKLNCNSLLLHKKFLKRISKASLSHVKTILKPSSKINDQIMAEYLFRYLVCGLNQIKFRSVIVRLLYQMVYLPRNTRIFTCLPPVNDWLVHYKKTFEEA